MPAHRTPRWTAAELQLLREHYPSGGLDAVAPLLPRRSWRSIYVQAHRLGFRRPPAATNAHAPKPKLCGKMLEEAIRLREEEGWSFARIGARFGVAEASACNAVLIALCPRKGFTPAQRDANGRLTGEGLARLRYALRKGLKAVDIQLRLGVSASCVAEQRRRYNSELKASGKAPLPPPGGGEAYSGVKLTRAAKTQVEGLLMQGFGTLKTHQRTGVSHTSIGRIRNRLIRRLRRKGETLPGCDARGVRHVQAESSAHIPDEAKAALRAMILERVPVRRAAKILAIGTSSAYRIRDEFAATVIGELPKPKRHGRVGAGSLEERFWPPRGPREFYAFRALLRSLPFDQAKAEWRRARRAEQEAERARPKTFEEQLARIQRGEIGLEPAITRKHLETTMLPHEERPPIAA